MVKIRIKYTSVRQKVILKINIRHSGNKYTFKHLNKKTAQGCQISVGSILTGIVPNQRWNGASFTTPTTTSVARAAREFAKHATLNEWQL